MKRILAILFLAAAPLAAQAPDIAVDTPVTGAAAAAVAKVRQLYDQQNYAGAMAAADSAMRQGLGSTELQSWRLVSLAQQPNPGLMPMRTARRMASMHPNSPWAWMGLALTAAAVPDSAAVARAAADKAVALAPNDTVIRRMTERARQAAGAAHP